MRLMGTRPSRPKQVRVTAFALSPLRRFAHSPFRPVREPRPTKNGSAGADPYRLRLQEIQQQLFPDRSHDRFGGGLNPLDRGTPVAKTHNLALSSLGGELQIPPESFPPPNHRGIPRRRQRSRPTAA